MKSVHATAAQWVIAAVVFTAAFSAGLSYADQMKWMSEEKARSAVGLLGEQAFVRYFCKPCGDEHSEMIIIDTLESVYTGKRQFWEVKINGAARDLAYMYIRQDDRWVNLAYKLNFVPYESPHYLNEY